MNVTVKLPDDLCREARHRAVNEDKSLSGWLADLIRREVAPPQSEGRTLAERLGDPETADRDFELPDRGEERERSIEFP